MKYRCSGLREENCGCMKLCELEGTLLYILLTGCWNDILKEHPGCARYLWQKERHTQDPDLL